MNRKAIFLAWLHLVVSIYLVVPKEFFHALHAHDCHETQDVHDYSRELVSTLHHHCETLQLDAPPVACEVKQSKNISLESIPVYFDQQVYNTYLVSASIFHQRGPPALN